MKASTLARPAMWVVLGVAAYGLVRFAFVTVMNADFHGRLIEALAATGASRTKNSDDVPTVRLVLRRLPPDENTIEASLILMTRGGSLATAIGEGKTSITATVREGSSFQPFGIGHNVTLDALTAAPEAGVAPVAVESRDSLCQPCPQSTAFPSGVAASFVRGRRHLHRT